MDDFESQWQIQMMEMRSALEEVKRFNSKAAEAPLYGEDLGLDDSDFEDGNISDEFLADFEQNGSSDTDYEDGAGYDRDWLADKCVELANKRGGGGAIPASILEETLVEQLSSSKDDNQLQEALFETVGFDDFDFISELLAHRQEILQPRKKVMMTADGHRILSPEELEEQLRKQDREHKSRALGPKLASEVENYPHIYRAHDAGNTLDAFGHKYRLPPGSTTTQYSKYEEITVPASKVGSVAPGRKLVAISEMDKLCQETFKGYKSLNRMQSLVYPVAYKTNENMLICAPTGAGKTDAAMLTVLNCIARNCVPSPLEDPTAEYFVCQKNDFKIIYVAPMKALAAEIVVKLGKRLAWMGIEVRELTGDMHMTKAEILRTNIIVTTPEKWDVVTRKSTGDTELVQKVRLLIIDEVHMLHDERGAVIESLVARTQRQVESSQSMIRIVGLSATLPNYVDVSSFLKVNPYQGLFYFDASFRPVPLEQHFLGVRGKAGTRISNENLDRTAYDKVKEMLECGHQVMVFVHSRKDTVKTARTFFQLALDEECTDLFTSFDHPDYENSKREMDRSKLKELRDLFQKGFAVHHAGMLRSDRNLVERLFGMGAIKVLVCTATLAWGVNLPAAAVVIKGTQVYDSSKGQFVDLGILDVLQIFGRAGRPQFQDTGIGFICTTIDKLAHYIQAVTQQVPIESQFGKRIVDNLNAEIALGTVTTVSEGVQWLGYTYMFVRWKKNPLFYGMNWDVLTDDPGLVQRRREFIIKAAKDLAKIHMIAFDENTEVMTSRYVGRIASNFYILNESIELFTTLLKPKATEADAMAMLSMSKEFDNITARDSEATELDIMKQAFCPCAVPKKAEAAQIKTNILLQAHISRAQPDDFALISDLHYVAQNGARITRALFMLALQRRWGNLASVLLALSKSIDQRIWPYEHPLKQFGLQQQFVNKLEEKETVTYIESLREMEKGELGNLVNNQKMGPIIFRLLESFPTISVESEIAPLNREVLRVKLKLLADFRWDDRIHGTSESFWVWLENSETSDIFHSEYFILSKKKVHDEHEMHFTIPLSDPLPTQIYVRVTSDKWLGSETVHPISFKHLIRPDTDPVYTELEDLPLLHISALNNPVYEEICAKRFQFFNRMQTQVFPILYNTDQNVLLGSPTGSGKTMAAELAMWQSFRDKPGMKVVYIAPMKALVRERVNDWGKRLVGPLNKKLVELTGDNTPDTSVIQNADIIITTPEKWDGISRSWQSRNYVKKVSLIIIDEIHLLGGDRGPILEIIVSRMNYIGSKTGHTTRILGMSSASANASDLASWLGVTDGLYNFRNSVRPVPLQIHIEGFPEIQGFCPFMASMNRPTFLAIKMHSPQKPVIVFVASRRQTRLTARDLIHLCGMEDNPRRFLNMEDWELETLLSSLKDNDLKESIQFGIGLHHAGMAEKDRSIVEELFLNGKIQILVATATLAWGVNLPAHLVIVKGTQFYDAKIEGYKDMDLTDVLQMMGRAGRPQFDTSGTACVFTKESTKPFYKYFLHTGFPVESSLHKAADDHLGAEIQAGTIKKKEDAIQYLKWTFLFRRLHKNPTYYGMKLSIEDHDFLSAEKAANEFLDELVDKALGNLNESGCITANVTTGDVQGTNMGKVASYYYLSHRTMRHFLKHMKRNATFKDCLSWMSSAAEYDELPVRHNEDLINIELAKELPLNTSHFEPLPMWDPHIKAYILIQAFFQGMTFPVSDYLTDQYSVLDQAIRIIQAAIDVLTELGYFSSVMTMINLLQALKQGVWPEVSPLRIFPGVTAVTKRELLKYKSVTDLARLPKKQLEKVLSDAGVPDFELNGITNVAACMPLLDVTARKSDIKDDTIEAIFERENLPYDKGYKLYAPRFPKTQQEGWFALLVEEGRDFVHATKRCMWHPGNSRGGGGGRGRGGRGRGGRGRGGRGAQGGDDSEKAVSEGGANERAQFESVQRERVEFKMPEGVPVEKLKVWIVSDGYLNVAFSAQVVERKEYGLDQ
ncbi:Sec63-domain-containing protein [Ascobolus immersus RN42]|uniref:Sec63-domain-containing protein n=1 Tax=Ascobolus immersus RN42 TaxID=1160509 RepID=A0A3N4HQQ2_ASCIM|nr:Sec63-domain-containing protein [Ascobolus immersus RN42]